MNRRLQEVTRPLCKQARGAYHQSFGFYWPDHKGRLTVPPSRTSWSSVTIRMMLLGLAAASAHLTQQVSSAKRVTAARCPPRRLPVDPGALIGPAIRASARLWEHTHTHMHTHTHAQRCSAESFDSCPVEEGGLSEWVCSVNRIAHEYTHWRGTGGFEEVDCSCWGSYDHISGRSQDWEQVVLDNFLQLKTLLDFVFQKRDWLSVTTITEIYIILYYIMFKHTVKLCHESFTSTIYKKNVLYPITYTT